MKEVTPEYDALVASKPTPYTEDYAITCPECTGTELDIGGGSTTLLGWNTARGPLADPNHRWIPCTCLNAACGLKFTVEIQRDNVWYTRPERPPVVLRGRSSCFEHYVYPCSWCGAEAIHREYRDLDGNVDTSGIRVTTMGGPTPRHEVRIEYAVCKACRAEARVHPPGPEEESAS